MANILEKPLQVAGNSWKGGMSSGLVAGLCEGLPAMIGIHPFFARLGGGILAAVIVKDATDKRVILNEATKEAVYQLLAGE